MAATFVGAGRERAEAWFADGRLLLAIAVALGLVARLIALVKFADLQPATANIWEYGDQARCAFLHHIDLCGYYKDRGLAPYPSAYMPPLLSYVWLGLFRLFGDTAAARAAFLGLGLLASAANIALVFGLARRLGGSPIAAFFAAAVMTLYPTFVFITTTYHQTNVAVLLLLAIVWLCIDVLDRPTIGLPLCAALGVTGALATLNRSEMLFIAPALIVGVAAWRRAPRVVVVAGLAFALTLSPWVARNWIVFHRFVPAAQSSGYNLWKGFNPYTNGSGRFSETFPPSANAAERIRQSVPPGPLYEPRIQDAFLRAATSYIAEAGPPRLVQLTATKVALLWGFDWTDRKITGGWAYRLPWLATNLLALAGAVALWRSGRVDPRAAAVIAGALLLLTAGYAATDVHSRYRMHIEPFLFMLSGVGLETGVLLAWRGTPVGAEPVPDPPQ